MGKMVDQSKIVAEPLQEPEEHLQRSLSNRHIQLIAIGGAIGTGLFMGSANHQPCRAVDHFRLYDHWFYVVFRDAGNGELLLSNLNYKSFSDFSADLLGPWAGFHRLDLLVLLGHHRYC